MKLTRLAVAIAFLVMALALLADFRPLSAQGNCGNCGAAAGTIKKCNGSVAVVTDVASGNCILVTATVETDANLQPVHCTVTTFYNCAAPEPSGCPIGGGSSNGGC